MRTKSLKGGRLTRAGEPSGLEATTVWLRISNSIVVTLDQAVFGSEIKYVCGVGTLMLGNVVA